jgi:hypothetical protein
MLLSIVPELVRYLVKVPAAVSRSRAAKDAEVLASRHENAVLRRPIARVRYEPADWIWLAVLSRLVLRVVNTGKTTCTLRGYAGLALEGARHEAVHTSVRHGSTYFAKNPGVHTVTLKGGASAWADLVPWARGPLTRRRPR